MPRSASFIPLARPWMNEREIEAVRRPILSGWVTQGPEVAEFEKRFAAYVGAPFACAVSSCTNSMYLALLCLGIGPGDEVITVSHSFIATANCIRHCGAVPVFVDVEPATFNIRPDQIEPAITPKTRAVLCVHQLGMPCDLRRVLEVAQRHDLPVVEDAACAIGSEIEWQGRWTRIGAPHGSLACFSFHARKVLTTGDGGMITTSNADWDERLRRLRHHGMSVPTTTRHRADEIIFETYPEVAYSYRMTDIQAAIGQVQLARLPEMVARRRRLAARYSELLADIPGLGLPQEPAWARSNWQSYCVRLPAGCDQRRVMQSMLAEGVATRRGVMCSHREEAHADCPPRMPLPESEACQDHCILLPLFHELSERDQHRVAETLRRACAG